MLTPKDSGGIGLDLGKQHLKAACGRAWIVAMPLEVTKLAIELPLASALKPPEPCDIVAEPLRRSIEPRPFLEYHDVAGAEVEPVTQLAPNIGARMRRAVFRELPCDGCALKLRDCHEVVVREGRLPLSNGSRLSCGALKKK